MYDDLLGNKKKEVKSPGRRFNLVKDEADPIATKHFKDKLRKYTDCLEADCSQCQADCMYAFIG